MLFRFLNLSIEECREWRYGSMESVDCIDRDKMYNRLTWRDKHKQKQTRINHSLFGAANASIITLLVPFVRY